MIADGILAVGLALLLVYLAVFGGLAAAALAHHFVGSFRATRPPHQSSWATREDPDDLLPAPLHWPAPPRQRSPR